MPAVPAAVSRMLRGPDQDVRLVPLPHSARIIDAVLMGCLVLRQSVVPGPIPTVQLAILVLVGISLFRRPPRRLGLAGWFPWLAVVLLGYATVVSLGAGVDPWRRLGNLLVLMAMAGFLASGRIDIGSAIKGLWAGLAINTVLFYAHLAPNAYAGRLTGYLQDPNAGGMVIAVGSLLATLTVRRRWTRAALIILGGLAIIATGSRTTLAGYLLAVVWLCLTGRLNRWGQFILGAGLAGAFYWANTHLVDTVGGLLNRGGSDALRARIDHASTEKALTAPWSGYGLGQGNVTLDGQTWFFNSSYQDLIVEGGILLAVGIIMAYVLAGFGLRATGAMMRVRDYDARVIAASTMMVFFCATRLGEVFFSPVGMFVLGVGLARLSIMTPRQGVDPQPITVQSPRRSARFPAR